MRPLTAFAAALALLGITGCGTTRGTTATEQLVVSDAVDRNIQRIDFRPLSGEKVYLDTSYMRHVKGSGFVNAEYVISAMRQQIVAAGCLIQDSAQEADIIIEGRIGVLGEDDHRVTFGLPENNALASAVSLIPTAPKLPAIPEIALARRDAREAATKVAAFAYDRLTRQPIWQSGVKHSWPPPATPGSSGLGRFRGARSANRPSSLVARSDLGRAARPVPMPSFLTGHRSTTMRKCGLTKAPPSSMTVGLAKT